MTYKPSDYFTALLTEAIACGFPGESDLAVRQDVLREMTHIKLYLNWHHDQVIERLPKEVREAFHTEMLDRIRQWGHDCWETWDGADFAWGHYVRRLHNYLVQSLHLNRPLMEED